MGARWFSGQLFRVDHSVLFRRSLSIASTHSCSVEVEVSNTDLGGNLARISSMASALPTLHRNLEHSDYCGPRHYAVSADPPYRLTRDAADRSLSVCVDFHVS